MRWEKNIQRAFCLRTKESKIRVPDPRELQVILLPEFMNDSANTVFYEWVYRDVTQRRPHVPLGAHVPALAHARVHSCIGNPARTRRQVRAYTNIFVSLRFPRYPLRIYLPFRATRTISLHDVRILTVYSRVEMHRRKIISLEVILNCVNDSFAFYDDSLRDCYDRRLHGF